MKEIQDILTAYFLAAAAGKKTALATVVKVEGSSYRQPGARMLVTEDGELTGAISGGCLEGDALRKALLAINQEQNKLITYDTSNEDDVEFGVQLGCNGILHILFEYIDVVQKSNPISLLQQLQKERKDAVVTTLFSQDRKALQHGTILFYRNDSTISADAKFHVLVEDCVKVLENKASVIKKVTINEMAYEALYEFIAPPISLVVCGAGNDAKPVVGLASLLGWEIRVFDGRATHATSQRFPKATTVSVAKPEEVLNEIEVDDRTFFVLMTHNYNYDLKVLELLVATNCKYIGMLGPKTKRNRMVSELKDSRVILSESQLSSIYGPIGLDLGAETSEEIALSIVSEIQAVIRGKRGTSLKYKEDKIHTATAVV